MTPTADTEAVGGTVVAGNFFRFRVLDDCKGYCLTKVPSQESRIWPRGEHLRGQLQL